MTDRPMFVLGTMLFGNTQDEQLSFELLDRFVDAGGTVLDTADCYAFWLHPDGHGGTSEELLGRWLAARPGMRDRVRISTKVGAEPVPPGEWPDNREGLSPTAIKAGIEGSLRRLGVDHVDVFWTHVDDRSVPLVDVVGALGELVAAGTVGQLGVSNQPSWRVEQARQLAAANGHAGYTAVQLAHTYLQRRPVAYVDGDFDQFSWATHHTVDHVRSEGLELWAYTPLLRGGYTRPDRMPAEFDHPNSTARLAALDEVAAELGATRNQVVLAWLAADPTVRPIVGVSSAAQLDEAAAGMRLELAPEQLARLDAAG
ncbi:aldo/keto reductase [Pseudonocardia sp. CA-107938]|uniref:aldo/keto reductase n=1 Tax=Pseudonocardia sp. CA-107938 TaxID=3240021 RepID=UPI003D907E08